MIKAFDANYFNYLRSLWESLDEWLAGNSVTLQLHTLYIMQRHELEAEDPFMFFFVLKSFVGTEEIVGLRQTEKRLITVSSTQLK